MKIIAPVSDEQIKKLKVYDHITINGIIYAGRDIVLPKIVNIINNKCIDNLGIKFRGSIIFHTAVSCAGIGPTSSNKLDIESSIIPLSKVGVKIHLGKGNLNKETVEGLKKYNSIFAITPPVTALFSSKLLSKKIVAFPREGMEAFYELSVIGIPAIIAIAHGVSIFNK